MEASAACAMCRAGYRWCSWGYWFYNDAGGRRVRLTTVEAMRVAIDLLGGAL